MSPRAEPVTPALASRLADTRCAAGPHVPVTLLLALAASAGTLVLHDRPALWSGLTTWMLHTDIRHLACDLLTFVALGCWAERRFGPLPVAVWITVGWLASQLAHATLHPDDAWLFGLSAIGWTVAAAAAAHLIRSREGAGWIMLGAIVFLLIYELLRSGRGPMVELGEALAARSTLIDANVRPVPGVHATCALAGAAAGAATPLRPRHAE